jgi:16S rRNA (guanine966-N2)-methyltransferase
MSLRPTTDRVKEAIFSILGSRIKDVEVADLCCGSGGLGIEALSRGAAFASFIDTSPRALSFVRGNLKRCEVPTARFRICCIDAMRWLQAWGEEKRQEPLIVLADPPYGADLTLRLWAEMVRLPARAPLVAAVLECPHECDLKPPAGGDLQLRWKRYGRSALAILEADHA